MSNIGMACSSITGAEKVGRENFARSAENTQPANMARASSHGSATAKRAGVDCSVTKVRPDPHVEKKKCNS